MNVLVQSTLYSYMSSSYVLPRNWQEGHVGNPGSLVGEVRGDVGHNKGLAEAVRWLPPQKVMPALDLA